MELVQTYAPVSRPENPTCSVCIANYNGLSLLNECLKSVMNQSGELDLEIIVHDDASTDESVSYLRKNFPNISILASTENVGFCVSNNRMVEFARGKYILLLNNDAALESNAIETLLTASQAQPSEGILTLPQYDWKTDVLVDRGCFLDPFHNPVPNLDIGRVDVAMVIGACMFMPRKLWHDLGGFPTWLESIAEDMYLCCAARLQGIPVQVTRDSRYRHLQGKSFGGNRADSGRLSTTFRRRRLSERNKTAVLLVCTPTALVWPLFGLHMACLILEGAALTLIQRNTRIWKDIYAPVFSFLRSNGRSILVRRKGMQQKRNASLRSYANTFVPLPQKLRLFFKHGLPTIR
ncbi:glycosyltransferase family 2 protein [Dyella mobilis]|uniref:Glycosyltransferase n=1 Tax=Dyella mobilis TaxID=1849582 RepID=A0ABS2KFX9_9GAMM|nr:glycosyltransferase [Dyella mobilis]MBM7130059.1 glycosyltransferase [Dyella mobilis]